MSTIPADFVSSILPKEKLPVTRINPKIALFYGPPKIGKTTLLAELENLLLLDFEKGAEAIAVKRIPITGINNGPMHDHSGTMTGIGLAAVCADIERIGMEEFTKTGKTPKPPFKYIAVDTIDKLEDLCEASATVKYKESTIGKNFDGKSVLELHNGGGYYYLRNEMILWIDRLSRICENLILISHIKEKLLNKGGIDVTIRDIALAGKLGQIVCAKCDVIGYIYREPGKTVPMVSFETFDNAIMGARFPRLAGQKFEFDWNRIYVPENQ